MKKASSLAWPVLLAGLAAWTIGFAMFTADALVPSRLPGRSDGIAVLTGGQDRITTALSLLHRGYAQRLLISGVGPRATFAHLGIMPDDPAIARITLGRHAVTTIGNALEAAQWAHANKMHRIIVVTAGYHIRRALVELRRAAPDVDFEAYAVLPPALHHPATRSTALLLLREYTKLLGAWIGVTRGRPMA